MSAYFKGNKVSLKSTVDGGSADSKLNKDFVYNLQVDYVGDAVTLAQQKYNPITNSYSRVASPTLALADEINAGLMSPSNILAIADLQSDVAALKGQTVRLLYTGTVNATHPLASEIQTFVSTYTVRGATPYSDPSTWPGIAVVMPNTYAPKAYHIWHYYGENTGWVDDGTDTVRNFTNETPGLIKGAAQAGKVYAEQDGIGSVYGWDALNSIVAGKQDNLVSGTNIKTLNGQSLLGTGNFEVGVEVGLLSQRDFAEMF